MLKLTVKFSGSDETFAEIISNISEYVNWKDITDSGVRVELASGVVVTYHCLTNTVMFQGPPNAAAAIKQRFLRAGRLAIVT